MITGDDTEQRHAEGVSPIPAYERAYSYCEAREGAEARTELLKSSSGSDEAELHKETNDKMSLVLCIEDTTEKAKPTMPFRR